MLENRLFSPSFDLQLFADEVAEVQTESAESSNPLLDYLQGNETSESEMTSISEQAEPVAEEAEVAEAPISEEAAIAQALQETGVLKKFGGDPQKLINSHLSLEREFTNRSMQLSEAKKEAEAYKQRLAELEAKAQQPAPEEPQVDFMDQFLENPMGAIEALVQKGVAERVAETDSFVKGLQQEREYEKAIVDTTSFAEQFSQSHPDISQYTQEMNEYLETLSPELASRPPSVLLEEAYYIAKGRTTPSFEDMLNDPTDEILQKIASSPAKDKLIQSYLTEVKQAQAGAPTTIGSSSGGVPTVASPENPRTLAEAGKAFLSSLGR